MQQVFHDLSALEICKGKRPLLVCDGAFDAFGVALPCEAVRFSGFTPNPRYEDVKAGVKALRKNKCDFIVAIGGGSSMDTAKGIKYYNHVNLPVLAVPTTSGTGSEATHFAAIYKDGEKRSVADANLLPDYVILAPGLLKTVPVYQKKCTMMDALCQAIESWWSRRATPESVRYSHEAIHLILKHMDGYLRNEEAGNKNMLDAAHLAGRAINITTTTAPHAMSYKLTTLYGLPHGHAAALCLPKVWQHMKNFGDIAHALGQKNCEDAAAFLERLLHDLELLPPPNAGEGDLDVLANSVNAQRLRNHPVPLDKNAIRNLYKLILGV